MNNNRNLRVGANVRQKAVILAKSKIENYQAWLDAADMTVQLRPVRGALYRKTVFLRYRVSICRSEGSPSTTMV
jgi:hypothetical protein